MARFPRPFVDFVVLSLLFRSYCFTCSRMPFLTEQTLAIYPGLGPAAECAGLQTPQASL
ncbi:hypothetical protein WDU94_009022, partial [Cyamophila willieti]